MTHDMGEYDAYNYWEDVEYLSDGHYDIATNRLNAIPTAPQPAAVPSQEQTQPQRYLRKRKAVDVSEPSRNTKKKKKLAGCSIAAADQAQGLSASPTTVLTAGRPVVIWRDHSAINCLNNVYLPEIKSAKCKRNLKPVALLKDWRLRFSDAIGFSRPHAKDDGAEIRDDQVPSGDDGRDDDDVDDHEVPKFSVDLTDLKAVASALTEESMEALRVMLTAKGIPIEALDVVLKDMLEGREIESASEDEQEQEQPQEHEAEPQNEKQGSESMNGRPRRRTKLNDVTERGDAIGSIVEVQDSILTESNAVVSRRRRRRI